MNITASKTGSLSRYPWETTCLVAMVTFGLIVTEFSVAAQSALSFEITPAYSNAVARVLMPEFSDFVRRLRLPFELPLSTNFINRFACSDRAGDVGGGVWLKNGSFIIFERGHVNLYETTNSYFGLQDPNQIPRFYGTVNLSRGEAIQVARDTIGRLGHSLESVFAELEPDVHGPIRSQVDTDKWIPHYLITWKYPSGGITSAELAVNGETGEVTRIYFLNRNLHRPPPKVDVPQTPLPEGRAISGDPLPVNPEYLQNLKPLALEAANEFLKKTGLGTAVLTTNEVERFDHILEPTGVDTLITLTNGTTFVFKLNRITRYKRPDAFFTANRPYVIADFKGEWRLTEEGALEKARNLFARLEEPHITLDIGLPPKSQYKPRTPGFEPPLIPRVSLHWSQKDAKGRFLSNADAEVNMETGEITYVGWSHRDMLGDAPKIDVPIQPPKN